MKTFIRVMCFAFATLLTACNNTDDGILKQEAEKAISNALKDPSSAQFSDEFIVRGQTDKNGDQTVSVCGLVNGKNSFGAYVGASRFVVSFSVNIGLNDADILWSQIDDGDNRATLDTEDSDNKTTVFEKDSWNPDCVDATHPPMYTGQNIDSDPGS